MQDEAFLNAVVQYARCGDPGALRYLRKRPFGAWARRVERNMAMAAEDDAHAPPPEFVAELTEALGRLDPVERRALHEALSRSQGASTG